MTMARSFPFKEFLFEFLTKSLPSLFLSLVLFVGGIVLLALRIPFWSLFLGLPASQIGIVFLIFTFESFSRKKSVLPTKEYHMVSCLNCSRQTIAPKYIHKKICDDCQVKIAQKIKSALVVFYILVTIPLTVGLAKKNLELRRKALEPSPPCDSGIWNPLECRCGTWQENQCPPEKRARDCQGEIFCCFQKEDQTWDCQPVKDIVR